MESIELITKDPIKTEVELCPSPRINLSTSEDIRREMARIYRETRLSKTSASDGTKLIYMLAQILRAHEIYSLEKRLINIENISPKLAR
jgi:hypothetical protein